MVVVIVFVLFVCLQQMGKREAVETVYMIPVRVHVCVWDRGGWGGRMEYV